MIGSGLLNSAYIPGRPRDDTVPDPGPDLSLAYWEAVGSIGNEYVNPRGDGGLYRADVGRYSASVLPTISVIDDPAFESADNPNGTCFKVTGEPGDPDGDIPSALAFVGGKGQNGDGQGFNKFLIPCEGKRNIMMRCKARVPAGSVGSSLELRAKFYTVDDINSWEFGLHRIWDDTDDIVAGDVVELIGWCNMPVTSVLNTSIADTMGYVQPKVVLRESPLDPSTIHVTDIQVAFDVPGLSWPYVAGDLPGSGFVPTPEFTNVLPDPRMVGGATGFGLYGGATNLLSPDPTGSQLDIVGTNKGVRTNAVVVVDAGVPMVWQVEVEAPVGFKGAIRLEHITAGGAWTDTSAFNFEGTGEPETYSLAVAQKEGYVGVRLAPVHATLENTVAGTVKWDKMMFLIDAEIIPPYFDGDSADADWDGTPNLSSSTFTGQLEWRSPSYSRADDAELGVPPVQWPRFRFGASSQDYDLTQNDRIAELAELGVDVLRDQFQSLTGDTVLQASGDPADLDWARYDPIFDACDENGVRVLGVLFGGPAAWREVPGTTHGRPAPDHYADYGQIAIEFADRYGDLLYGIELWNEPNLGAGIFANGADFGAFMAANYDAIKAAHPDLKVVHGGLATAPTSNTYKIEGFWNAAYPEMAGATDACNLHIYLAGRSGQALGGASLHTGDDGWIHRMRQAMQALDEELPIWVTETGKSTLDPSHFIFGNTTDDEQADVIGLEWDRLALLPYVEQVSVHTVRVNEALTGAEAGYGLVSIAGTRRPSFNRLKNKARYSQLVS